jgi:hypothetical protein
MNASDISATQLITGILLVFSGFVFAVGGILYTGRAIWKWPAGQTHRFLLWERGFVIASILVLNMGLLLLARILDAAGSIILAPLSMVTFFSGVVSILVAETLNLSRQVWVYSAVVMFVVLAFLSQAAMGAALIQTAFLPLWVGWTAVIWNLAWLVIMPIARPENMYYPWLHFAAPSLIGIGLLLGL